MALDKKLEEEKEDVLALGEKQEKRIEKKKQKKKIKIPIFMMIFGFCLMVFGYFYSDIATFFGMEFSKFNKKTEEERIKDPNVLNCIRKSEDSTLGIATTSEYIYTFKKQKLKKMTEIRTLTPIKYSDIGPDNIRIYSGKYSTFLENIPLIDGFSATSEYQNNILTFIVNIDFFKIDINKIPQNEFINIDYQYNEERSSVRQKIAKDKDTLCE